MKLDRASTLAGDKTSSPKTHPFRILLGGSNAELRKEFVSRPGPETNVGHEPDTKP